VIKLSRKTRKIHFRLSN